MHVPYYNKLLIVQFKATHHACRQIRALLRCLLLTRSRVASATHRRARALLHVLSSAHRPQQLQRRRVNDATTETVVCSCACGNEGRFGVMGVSLLSLLFAVAALSFGPHAALAAPRLRRAQAVTACIDFTAIDVACPHHAFGSIIPATCDGDPTPSAFSRRTPLNNPAQPRLGTAK